MKKGLLLYLLVFVFSSFQSFAQAGKKDLYNNNTIHELRLKLKQADWKDKLDSLRIYGEGMLLGEARIDGSSYKNVGIRYLGTRAFTKGGNKNSLFIKLNFINKKQKHQDYKSLVLSNALRDPSMVREVLAYEIAQKYMHAPRASYTKLYINNKYVGLFVNVEDINQDFLDKHFHSHDNSFFRCIPNIGEVVNPKGCKKKIYASLEYEDGIECYLANYEMKSETGWDDLIELSRMLKDEPEKISSVLNVDQTLWMHAFNNVIVNLNSYTGQHSINYYLYKDNFGKFNPMIWAMNLSFGSFKNTGSGSDLTLSQLQSLDPLLHQNDVTKPLIKALLSNPQYKKIYLAHMRTILYDNFVNGEYEKRAKELQRMISNAMFEDPNKFYEHSDFLKSLNTTIGKRSKIPGIVELMNKRARFLKKHPQLTGIPPQVTTVTVLKREKFSNKAVNKFSIQAKVLKRAKKVKLYYRFDKTKSFEMMLMSDDGKSSDGSAGDKVFGATVNPNGAFDSLEYYIIAENAIAMSYYPHDYMFEPLETSLKELNQ